MPSRTLLQLSARARVAPTFSTAARRFYSAQAAEEPLIRVSNLPAPGSGHIRVLELNRPEARNAISRRLLTALREEIDSVRHQYTEHGEELPPNKLFGGAAGVNQKGPTRALVIASAVDSCFCAGADLKERKEFSKDETDAFLEALRATFSAIAAVPVPTISAVSSLALGGGLELALSTHFRVFSSNAVVGLPETRLGIIPGAGGTYRLPALVGLGRARDLILTGRRVSGPEAYFLGLADRLVEVTETEAGEAGEDAKADPTLLARAQTAALSEAVRLAMEICEGGPVAVRAGLEAVAWAREEVENKMYERVVDTDDRNEALRAFQEKRTPVFTGR